MKQEKSFWGSGWSFPPTFTLDDHQLVTTHGAENIQQSIDIIIATQKGERSLMPNWGMDLNSFLFGPLTGGVKNEIISSIRLALLNFEPRIRVLDISVEQMPDSAAHVGVFIEYLIKKTNTRHNHVYPFSDLEGTNLVTPIPR